MSIEQPTGRGGKFTARFSALMQNFKMTQKVYKFVLLEVLGIYAVVAAAVIIPVGYYFNYLTAVILGLPAGALAAVFWFGRRAMKAAYKSIEGQPGAAAAVVENMRGNWFVTPAVAANRNQDLVSRVVGRCGIVLISEGPSSRVVPMLATERKKTARWVPETPIFEIQVGTEEGQLEIGKLTRELSKLPSSLRGAEILTIRRRLEAVAKVQGPAPIPKGPMPKSAKQARGMRG